MRATVSGSFRKAMAVVQRAVQELSDARVEVLSPADPEVVDAFGEFLFVASDRLRNVRLVQQRHLEAIRNSDFVWLVCPDGYVGVSAAMEIGYACSVGVPVFADTPPSDLTLRSFVRVVPGPLAAIAAVAIPATSSDSILLDPSAAVEAAHRHLDQIRRDLLDPADRAGDQAVRSAATQLDRLIRPLI